MKLGLGKDTGVSAFWPWACSGKCTEATHQNVLDMPVHTPCVLETNSVSQCYNIIKLLPAESAFAFELMALLLALLSRLSH